MNQEEIIHRLKKKALLVIDVQRELFQKSIPIYRADVLLEKISALVERAHQKGVLVVYIQHCNESFLAENSEGWQLHDCLHPIPADLKIHKRHPSAFEQTNLKGLLDERGVETLVVTGLVTHGCVKATCLDANKLGYQVILVKDGHSSYSKQASELIEEWNEKLSHGTVTLAEAGEVTL